MHGSLELINIEMVGLSWVLLWRRLQPRRRMCMQSIGDALSTCFFIPSELYIIRRPLYFGRISLRSDIPAFLHNSALNQSQANMSTRMSAAMNIDQPILKAGYRKVWQGLSFALLSPATPPLLPKNPRNTPRVSFVKLSLPVTLPLIDRTNPLLSLTTHLTTQTNRSGWP